MNGLFYFKKIDNTQYTKHNIKIRQKLRLTFLEFIPIVSYLDGMILAATRVAKFLVSGSEAYQ
jgi:hypothetical protein